MARPGLDTTGAAGRLMAEHHQSWFRHESKTTTIIRVSSSAIWSSGMFTSRVMVRTLGGRRMAKYRKLYVRVWVDEKFRSLTTDDKLLAIYCLTSQQANRIGVYVFSFGMAAEHLGYPPDTLRIGMARVCDTLRWAFDEENSVLYIPQWWRYNGALGPKTIRGHLCDLEDLPNSPLIPVFFANREHLTAAESTVFDTYAIRIGGVYPFGAQDQDQEQEQDLSDQKGPDKPDLFHSDFTDDTASKVLPLVRCTFTPPLFPTGMDNNERLTLLRIAFLRVTSQMSENTLASALNGMKLRKGKPIENPVGYLLTTLATDPSMKGIDFKSGVNQIVLPPELLAAWRDQP